MKRQVVSVSYWALFVYAPWFGLALFLYAHYGLTLVTGGVTLLAFFTLLVIAEHGYRLWSRLWRADDGTP